MAWQKQRGVRGRGRGQGWRRKRRGIGRRLAGLGALSLLGMATAGCAADGTRATPSSHAQQPVASSQSADLTSAEADGLRFMREEEKLALDVYRALGERYDHVTFENIAAAEQRHMDAVGRLLARYGVDDPIAHGEPGVFDNDELQALYDRLMARGTQSLLDALTVGALIEEVDIADLSKHLAETDREDLRRVYENLQRGSRNHLRAFVRSIEAQGQSYQAQHLPAEEVAAIITGDHEPGAGRRGGGRGWRGGRGG